MAEWGIFNDDSMNYTADEAVEAGFYSEEEALKAIKERYSEEDDLEVAEVDEDDEYEDEDEEEEEEDE